jgi:hypothetical protein
MKFALHFGNNTFYVSIGAVASGLSGMPSRTAVSNLFEGPFRTHTLRASLQAPVKNQSCQSTA